MTNKKRAQKILIVDDNRDMARCLAEMADHLGIACELAFDGEQAIEKLSQETYFLIIADSHMPRISGFPLLKLIRRDYPGLPVAIISTHNSENTQGMVMKDQPDFYLPKPFKTEDLQKLLAQCHAKAGAHKLPEKANAQKQKSLSDKKITIS